jgi:hypothetical protein
VGRRAVLAALATTSAVALAGCDTGSPAIVLPGGSDAPDDADLPLVAQAVELCRQAREQLAPAAASAPLRAAVAPFVALHARHAEALRGAVPDGGSTTGSASPAVPPAAGVRTLDDVVALETRTRTGLVALAQRAESGQLARLLASMAAGISQRLVGLR